MNDFWKKFCTSRFSIKLRSLSFILALLFSWDTIAWSSPQPGLPFPKAQNLQKLHIPETLGIVEQEYFPANAAKAPQVIYIQDAHAQEEAQRNIKAILNYLQQQNKISGIYIEGARGKIDPSLLNVLPVEEANQAMADYLLKLGELTGSELYALGSHPIQVEGVEDIDRYAKSFELFQQLKTRKTEIAELLKFYHQKLEQACIRLFRGDLAKFVIDQKLWKEEGQMAGQLESLQRLSQKYLQLDLTDPRHQLEWPHLTRLLKVQEMEKTLDREKVQRDFEALKQTLEKQMPASEEKTFVIHGLEAFHSESASTSFREWLNQHIDSPELRTARYFFEKFRTITQKAGINLLFYPELLNFAGITILHEEIDAKPLLDEMEAAHQKLAQKLLRNSKEKRLYQLVQDFRLLYSFLNLQMTDDEAALYAKRQPFLEPDALRKRMEEWMDVRAGDPDLNPDWIKQAENFYEFSRQRDRLLVKNALDLSAKSKNKKNIVLIAGGFHSRGIQEILKEKRIPFATIRPHISHIGDESVYEKAMLGENSQSNVKAHALVKRPLLQPPVFYREQNPRPQEQAALIMKALHFSGVPVLRQHGWERERIRSMVAHVRSQYPALTLRTEKSVPVTTEISRPRSETRMASDTKPSAPVKIDLKTRLINVFKNYVIRGFYEDQKELGIASLAFISLGVSMMFLSSNFVLGIFGLGLAVAGMLFGAVAQEIYYSNPIQNMWYEAIDYFARKDFREQLIAAWGPQNYQRKLHGLIEQAGKWSDFIELLRQQPTGNFPEYLNQQLKTQTGKERFERLVRQLEKEYHRARKMQNPDEISNGIEVLADESLRMRLNHDEKGNLRLATADEIQAGQAALEVIAPSNRLAAREAFENAQGKPVSVQEEVLYQQGLSGEVFQSVQSQDNARQAVNYGFSPDEIWMHLYAKSKSAMWRHHQTAQSLSRGEYLPPVFALSREEYLKESTAPLSHSLEAVSAAKFVDRQKEAEEAGADRKPSRWVVTAETLLSLPYLYNHRAVRLGFLHQRGRSQKILGTKELQDLKNFTELTQALARDRSLVTTYTDRALRVHEEFLRLGERNYVDIGQELREVRQSGLQTLSAGSQDNTLAVYQTIFDEYLIDQVKRRVGQNNEETQVTQVLINLLSGDYDLDGLKQAFLDLGYFTPSELVQLELERPEGFIFFIRKLWYQLRSDLNKQDFPQGISQIVKKSRGKIPVELIGISKGQEREAAASQSSVLNDAQIAVRVAEGLSPTFLNGNVPTNVRLVPYTEYFEDARFSGAEEAKAFARKEDLVRPFIIRFAAGLLSGNFSGAAEGQLPVVSTQDSLTFEIPEALFSGSRVPGWLTSLAQETYQTLNQLEITPSNLPRDAAVNAAVNQFLSLAAQAFPEWIRYDAKAMLHSGISGAALTLHQRLFEDNQTLSLMIPQMTSMQSDDFSYRIHSAGRLEPPVLMLERKQRESQSAGQNHEQTLIRLAAILALNLGLEKWEGPKRNVVYLPDNLLFWVNHFWDRPQEAYRALTEPTYHPTHEQREAERAVIFDDFRWQALGISHRVLISRAQSVFGANWQERLLAILKPRQHPDTPLATSSRSLEEIIQALRAERLLNPQEPYETPAARARLATDLDRITKALTTPETVHALAVDRNAPGPFDFHIGGLSVRSHAINTDHIGPAQKEILRQLKDKAARSRDAVVFTAEGGKNTLLKADNLPNVIDLYELLALNAEKVGFDGNSFFDYIIRRELEPKWFWSKLKYRIRKIQKAWTARKNPDRFFGVFPRNDQYWTHIAEKAIAEHGVNLRAPYTLEVTVKGQPQILQGALPGFLFEKIQAIGATLTDHDFFRALEIYQSIALHPKAPAEGVVDLLGDIRILRWLPYISENFPFIQKFLGENGRDFPPSEAANAFGRSEPVYANLTLQESSFTRDGVRQKIDEIIPNLSVVQDPEAPFSEAGSTRYLVDRIHDNIRWHYSDSNPEEVLRELLGIFDWGKGQSQGYNIHPREILNALWLKGLLDLETARQFHIEDPQDRFWGVIGILSVMARSETRVREYSVQLKNGKRYRIIGVYHQGQLEELIQRQASSKQKILIQELLPERLTQDPSKLAQIHSRGTSLQDLRRMATDMKHFTEAQVDDLAAREWMATFFTTHPDDESGDVLARILEKQLAGELAEEAQVTPNLGIQIRLTKDSLPFFFRGIGDTEDSLQKFSEIAEKIPGIQVTLSDEHHLLLSLSPSALMALRRNPLLAAHLEAFDKQFFEKPAQLALPLHLKAAYEAAQDGQEKYSEDFYRDVEMASRAKMEGMSEPAGEILVVVDGHRAENVANLLSHDRELRFFQNLDRHQMKGFYTAVAEFKRSLRWGYSYIYTTTKALGFKIKHDAAFLALAARQKISGWITNRMLRAIPLFFVDAFFLLMTLLTGLPVYHRSAQGYLTQFLYENLPRRAGYRFPDPAEETRDASLHYLVDEIVERTSLEELEAYLKVFEVLSDRDDHFTYREDEFAQSISEYAGKVLQYWKSSGKNAGPERMRILYKKEMFRGAIEKILRPLPLKTSLEGLSERSARTFGGRKGLQRNGAPAIPDASGVIDENRQTPGPSQLVLGFNPHDPQNTPGRIRLALERITHQSTSAHPAKVFTSQGVWRAIGLTPDEASAMKGVEEIPHINFAYELMRQNAAKLSDPVKKDFEKARDNFRSFQETRMLRPYLTAKQKFDLATKKFKVKFIFHVLKFLSWLPQLHNAITYSPLYMQLQTEKEYFDRSLLGLYEASILPAALRLAEAKQNPNDIELWATILEAASYARDYYKKTLPGNMQVVHLVEERLAPFVAFLLGHPSAADDLLARAQHFEMPSSDELAARKTFSLTPRAVIHLARQYQRENKKLPFRLSQLVPLQDQEAALFDSSIEGQISRGDQKDRDWQMAQIYAWAITQFAQDAGASRKDIFALIDSSYNLERIFKQFIINQWLPEEESYNIKYWLHDHQETAWAIVHLLKLWSQGPAKSDAPDPLPSFITIKQANYTQKINDGRDEQTVANVTYYLVPEGREQEAAEALASKGISIDRVQQNPEFQEAFPNTGHLGERDAMANDARLQNWPEFDTYRTTLERDNRRLRAAKTLRVIASAVIGLVSRQPFSVIEEGKISVPVSSNSLLRSTGEPNYLQLIADELQDLIRQDPAYDFPPLGNLPTFESVRALIQRDLENFFRIFESIFPEGIFQYDAARKALVIGPGVALEKSLFDHDVYLQGKGRAWLQWMEDVTAGRLALSQPLLAFRDRTLSGPNPHYTMDEFQGTLFSSLLIEEIHRRRGANQEPVKMAVVMSPRAGGYSQWQMNGNPRQAERFLADKNNYSPNGQRILEDKSHTIIPQEIFHRSEVRMTRVLPAVNPTKTRAWSTLRNRDFPRVRNFHLRDLIFNSARVQSMSLPFQSGGTKMLLDYSKNRVDETTLKNLFQLARETQFEKSRDAIFRGERINETEGRAALHTALRLPVNRSVLVDGQNVVPQVHAVLDRMREISDQIRSGQWLGYTGKPITHVVHIGIGGSNLGPRMVTEALKAYAGNVKVHFVSNVDGTDITETLETLDPETTLFLVASKTFTTQETMMNATSAREWLWEKAGGQNFEAVKRHFIALSTAKAEVEKFGIAPENMLEFWNWVGGRYSLWSAIGLSIAISIGFDNFKELLAGAHDMDEHFQTTPLEQNIPVILALLDIWYLNFFGAQTHAILPYDQYLHRLPAHEQQVFMESLGKGVDRAGNKITDYRPSPIIWGEAGTNGQHSFYQLIHQSPTMVPADFIGFADSLNPLGAHHEIFMANFFAQPMALAVGKNREAVAAERGDSDVWPHKVFEGNRPTNTILFNRLTPRALGVLIAMYEHQVFTEGAILNVNSLDQYGVELGKKLADGILPAVQSGAPKVKVDASTANLLNEFRAMRSEVRSWFEGTYIDVRNLPAIKRDFERAINALYRIDTGLAEPDAHGDLHKMVVVLFQDLFSRLGRSGRNVITELEIYGVSVLGREIASYHSKWDGVDAETRTTFYINEPELEIVLRSVITEGYQKEPPPLKRAIDNLLTQTDHVGAVSVLLSAPVPLVRLLLKQAVAERQKEIERQRELAIHFFRRDEANRRIDLLQKEVDLLEPVLQLRLALDRVSRAELRVVIEAFESGGFVTVGDALLPVNELTSDYEVTDNPRAEVREDSWKEASYSKVTPLTMDEAQPAALQRVIFAEIKGRAKEGKLSHPEVKSLFEGKSENQIEEYFEALTRDQIEVLSRELSQNEIARLRSELEKNLKWQMEKAKTPFESAILRLRDHSFGDVAQIIEALYPKVLPYLIKGQDESPIHHAAHVLNSMAEILIDEYQKDREDRVTDDEVKVGMIAVLFHDSGVGYSTIRKIVESEIDDRQKDVDQMPIDTEERRKLKEKAQKDVDDLRKKAILARQQHMIAGKKITRLLLGEFNREHQGSNLVLSKKVIPDVLDIVKRHDNMKIPLLENPPNPKWLHKSGREDWLMQLHWEADSLWMDTEDGIEYDLMRARRTPGARVRTPLEQLDYNISLHRKSVDTFKKVFGSAVEAYNFKDGLLYRSEIGYQIFQRLDAEFRRNPNQSVDTTTRSELRQKSSLMESKLRAIERRAIFGATLATAALMAALLTTHLVAPLWGFVFLAPTVLNFYGLLAPFLGLSTIALSLYWKLHLLDDPQGPTHAQVAAYRKQKILHPQSLPSIGSLSRRDLQGKTVLVRIGADVPLDTEGHITNNKRVRASLDTITYLMDRGATVVILNHIGRPGGRAVAGLSNRVAAEELQKLLGERYPVHFMEGSINGNGVILEKTKVVKGAVNVLENTRFGPDETNSEYFAGLLASLGDMAVNDAPSVAHRDQSSTTGIVTQGAGPAYIGFAMEREQKALAQVNPDFILSGGAKVSDKAKVLKKIIARLPKGGRMTLGGAMAYTFMSVLGHKVGNSLVEPGQEAVVKEIVELAKSKGIREEDLLPLDHLIVDNFEKPTVVKVVEGDIPDGWIGVGVGPKTIARNRMWALQSKNIFWNGPMGVFERFENDGSLAMAAVLAEATKKSVKTFIGGGETATVAELYEEKNHTQGPFSYVFLGGGATLEYLEGSVWPVTNAVNDWWSGRMSQRRVAKKQSQNKPFVLEAPKKPFYWGINGPGSTGGEALKAGLMSVEEDAWLQEIYDGTLDARADIAILKVINGVREITKYGAEVGAAKFAERLKKHSIHGNTKSHGRNIEVKSGVDAKGRPYFQIGIQTARGEWKWSEEIYLFNDRSNDRKFPWGDTWGPHGGVQVVFDAHKSGKNDLDLVQFLDHSVAARFYPHLAKTMRASGDPPGAKRVVYATGSNVPMIMIGINHDQLQAHPEEKMSSNASCTTNCVAPVAKAIVERHGIFRAIMDTIHAFTNDQNTADMPHEDAERARDAHANTIRSKTGAAANVGEILSDLAKKFDGVALRVPVADGALSEMVMIVPEQVSAEAANALIRQAAEADMRGIIEYTEEDLVSTDIISRSASVIFQANKTKTIPLKDGTTMVKFGAAWYDNERGFSTRALDHVIQAALVEEKIAEGKIKIPANAKVAPAAPKKEKSKRGGSPSKVPAPAPASNLPKLRMPSPAKTRRVAIHGIQNPTTRGLIRRMLLGKYHMELFAVSGLQGILTGNKHATKDEKAAALGAARGFAHYVRHSSTSAPHQFFPAEGEGTMEAVEGGLENGRYIPGGQGYNFLIVKIGKGDPVKESPILLLDDQPQMWGALNVETVYETSGVKNKSELESHISNGAKRIIFVDYPDQGEIDIKPAQFGLNDNLLTPSDRIVFSPHFVASAAAPVIQVLKEKLGAMGIMLGGTLQLDQNDPHLDVSEGRAAGINIVPKEIPASLDQLRKLIPGIGIDGSMAKVPDKNASVISIDVVFPADSNITADDLNQALEEAAGTVFRGILHVVKPGKLGELDQKLASSDFNNNPYPANFVPSQTMVVDGRLAKILLWVDGMEASVTSAIYLDESMAAQAEKFSVTTEQTKSDRVDPPAAASHYRPDFEVDASLRHRYLYGPTGERRAIGKVLGPDGKGKVLAFDQDNSIADMSIDSLEYVWYEDADGNKVTKEAYDADRKNPEEQRQFRRELKKWGELTDVEQRIAKEWQYRTKRNLAKYAARSGTGKPALATAVLTNAPDGALQLLLNEGEILEGKTGLIGRIELSYSPAPAEIEPVLVADKGSLDWLPRMKDGTGKYLRKVIDPKTQRPAVKNGQWVTEIVSEASQASPDLGSWEAVDAAVRNFKRMGVDAIKLLVYTKPEDRKFMEAQRKFLEHMKKAVDTHDMFLMLEELIDGDGLRLKFKEDKKGTKAQNHAAKREFLLATNQTKAQAVIDSVKFIQPYAGILKLEFPGDGDIIAEPGDEKKLTQWLENLQEAREGESRYQAFMRQLGNAKGNFQEETYEMLIQTANNLRELNRATGGKPWLLLSAGKDFGDVFKPEIILALYVGEASGYMVGRAFWKDVRDPKNVTEDAQAKFLADETENGMTGRMIWTNRIVDRHAKSFWERLNITAQDREAATRARANDYTSEDRPAALSKTTSAAAVKSAPQAAQEIHFRTLPALQQVQSPASGQTLGLAADIASRMSSVFWKVKPQQLQIIELDGQAPDALAQQVTRIAAQGLTPVLLARGNFYDFQDQLAQLGAILEKPVRKKVALVFESEKERNPREQKDLTRFILNRLMPSAGYVFFRKEATAAAVSKTAGPSLPDSWKKELENILNNFVILEKDGTVEDFDRALEFVLNEWKRHSASLSQNLQELAARVQTNDAAARRAAIGLIAAVQSQKISLPESVFTILRAAFKTEKDALNLAILAGILAKAGKVLTPQESARIPSMVQAPLVNQLRQHKIFDNPYFAGIQGVRTLSTRQESGKPGLIENHPGIYVAADIGMAHGAQFPSDVTDQLAIATVKNAGDETSADGITAGLNASEGILAAVIIGEGVLDGVRTLSEGSKVGAAHRGFARFAIHVLDTEIAADPVELTEGLRLASINGTTTVLMAAKKGTITKLPESDHTYVGAVYTAGNIPVNFKNSVAANVQAISRGNNKPVAQVTVGQLFRLRHQSLVRQLIHSGIQAAYQDERGEWIRSLEWKADFETHFQAFWKYATQEIEKDGTFGISGEAAKFNHLKLFKAGTVGAVRAVGEGKLDAFYGSSAPAEGAIQEAMAKAYGLKRSARLISGKADDILSFNAEALITTQEWEALARFGINPAHYGHEIELIKGSDFVIHITALKDDVWDSEIKGLQVDTRTGIAQVIHHVIGGSGLIQTVIVDYKTKITSVDSYEKAAAFIAFSNGIHPRRKFLDQAIKIIQNVETQEGEALRKVIEAKRLIVAPTDAEVSSAKAQAIELLEQALLLDSQDRSGLIQYYLKALRGEAPVETGKVKVNYETIAAARSELRKQIQKTTPLGFDQPELDASYRATQKLLGDGRNYLPARWITVHVAFGFFLIVPKEAVSQVKPFLEWDYQEPWGVQPLDIAGSQAASGQPHQTGVTIHLLDSIPNPEEKAGQEFYFAAAEILKGNPDLSVHIFSIGESKQEADAAQRWFAQAYSPSLAQRLRIKTSPHTVLSQAISKAVQGVSPDHVTISGDNLAILSDLLYGEFRIHNDFAFSASQPWTQAAVMLKQSDLASDRLQAAEWERLKEMTSRVISAAREFLRPDELSQLSAAFELAFEVRNAIYQAA